MSKVDVVQRTGATTTAATAAAAAAAAAAAPPPTPPVSSSLESAMAAAAAVATTTAAAAAAATNATNATTTATTTTRNTTPTTTPTTTLTKPPPTPARPLTTTITNTTTNNTTNNNNNNNNITTTTTITAGTITAGILQQPRIHNAAAIAALPHSHSQIRTNGTKRPRPSDHRDGRLAKSRQRPLSSKTNNGGSSSGGSGSSMEPPVLSFYGTQPVPLPSRFASLKKRLVAGHEAALEASWSRLVVALRDEIKYIDEHRTGLIPSIDFTDIDDPAKVAPFESSLKRHGIGVIRGVVPAGDASRWVEETKKYLETKHDFKPPPAQDPTCFDFFWTPAQVRSRAHPNMLQAQRFAMSLWNCNNDDRLATRFPITYADRIRIESTSNGIITVNGVAAPPVPLSAEDSLIAAAAAASNASIAQVDNGSLERWELDGYGRCGLYDEIFRGNWEAYNQWDPAGRVNATSDLYNGAGACSMMRMFQGILALTIVEPGMISLLPSSKLSTVYFLLRPFFSPKEPAPTSSEEEDPEAWAKYLDPANWALDKEQSTIIHGAVPGHAQRVTAAWHPHLRLDKSLVTPPTLQVGDYIVWHPDQAYQFSNTNNYQTTTNTTTTTTAKPDVDAGGDTSHTSMLVYSPAAPLTQTNALFLARQRKAFLRGHPGPDFDSTGTGLGSEAPHTGRLGEKEIREVGGEEGLRAMGLAPWTTAKSADTTPKSSSPLAPPATADADEEKKDVDMDDAGGAGAETPASTSSSSRAESEVVRLANIILFPDRYDFYMPTRASSPVPVSREREKEGGDDKEKERERERIMGSDKGKRKERDSSSSTSRPTSREKERGKGKER